MSNYLDGYGPDNPLPRGIWRVKLCGKWELGWIRIGMREVEYEPGKLDYRLGWWWAIHNDYEQEDDVRDEPTLSQFTGLYDSEGTPIFEGDKWRSPHRGGFVEWRKGKWELGVRYAHMVIDRIELAEGRVIGNRWDNPELVGKEVSNV